MKASDIKIGDTIPTTILGEKVVTDINRSHGVFMFSFEGTDIRLGQMHIIGIEPEEREVKKEAERLKRFEEYRAARTPQPGLKKGKINISRWMDGIDPTQPKVGIYRLKMGPLRKTESEFSRSRGEVDCPFCGFIQTVFIWSFNGGGKRCDNCGVLLSKWFAIAEENRFINCSK